MAKKNETRTVVKADSPMSVEVYLSKVIAEQLVQELEPILKVKEVTTNSQLLGDYTEAAVRRLTRRVVNPLRVSTGAVIDYPVPPKLRQIDLIIWAPFPAPSIFEIDEFGLVPRSSVFGLMEIKRSSYSKAVAELEDFLKAAPDLIDVPRLGSVVAEPFPAMGVISVLEKKPTSRLKELLENNQVVAIFEKSSSKVSLRGKDVLRLINFLHYVTWRYRRRSQQETYLQLRTSF